MKKTGFYKIAKHPPLEGDFLVAKLWDKRTPGWRETALKPDPLDPVRDKEIIAKLKEMSDAAKATAPGTRLSLKEAAFMTINRTILRRKGKWQRVPDDA